METQNQNLSFKETYMDEFDPSVSLNTLKEIHKSLHLMDNPQEENDIAIEIQEYLSKKLDLILNQDESNLTETEETKLYRELIQTINYNLDLQNEIGGIESKNSLLKLLISNMNQLNHELQSEWDLLPES